jgi:flagellar FliL protein
MSDAPKPAAEGKAKKKSLMLLIVAAVVLLGGGGGGYWWWSNKAAAAASEHDEGEKKKEPETPPGVLSFEPFVANLADEGGARFLRIAVKLVVDDAEHATELQEDAVVVAQLRSAILEVLTERTADELVTPDGKASLKTAITEASAPLLHEVEITGVLFTEFVVQF